MATEARPTGLPRGFWAVQTVAWGLAAGIYLLGTLPGEGDPLAAAAMKLVWGLSGLLVSSALGWAFARASLATQPLPRAALVAVPAAFAAGLAWLMGLARLAAWSGAGPDAVYTARSFPFVASNFILVMLAWSGGWLSLTYWRGAQAEARKVAEARSLAREAQLAMLRYQLNPHFLFNALTSIRALVLERPDKAREMITRLADFLRYAIRGDTQGTVRVAEEVAVAQDYLAIEEVRFEDRIAVDVSVDPAAAELRIPALLLHPLVENAVKHGRPEGTRLVIRVRATVEDGELLLSVAGSGSLGAPARGEGLGLRNVRERLAATSPGRHRFTVEDRDGMVVATIAIRPGEAGQ